jgi:hypothetical protein
VNIVVSHPGRTVCETNPPSEETTSATDVAAT